MRLEDLDYDLPEQAIAQAPLEDRAASKLLLLNKHVGAIEDLAFRDVPDLLRAGDLLVLNDTRVTALRVFGEKPTGGRVELLLLKQTGPGQFEALAKPGRRLRTGAVVEFGSGLRATVIGDLATGGKQIQFEPVQGLRENLEQIGNIPLPPYIHRDLDRADRYQTVYNRVAGSAAAPTAGLHFTGEILDQLRAIGVKVAFVTLDVGLDTFRPITSENPLDHQIHGERCTVPEETGAAIREAQGRIIAVGTTAVRTLETFATGTREVASGERQSSLFITPGFRFRIVDGMFTNFHMPRTTMLLMISAMAGRENVMRAYAHALAHGYRFLSFGDSMLIL